MQIRLQKHLSEQGICSRRQAEDMICKKKIFINGKLAILGDKVSLKDQITIDGQKLSSRKQSTVILAFHKPKGVECTLNKIEKVKTLVDFYFGKKRVFPVGRLDKDSRGLLLLTNNGDLCNKINHPRYEHDKEYLVSLNKPLTPKIIENLSNGVLINDKKTKKCEVEQLAPTLFRIVLQEGRNRQIRKMCEVLKLTVTDLIRIRVHNIHLGELPVGKFRVLSLAERTRLEL